MKGGSREIHDVITGCPKMGHGGLGCRVKFHNNAVYIVNTAAF